ncbi:MAG: DUF1653 domain-containing protein [Candidatus Moranbacteria bacterium]|nr:DUF1653 domain-containing protein [Candidatus Moranbacteria bacterium]
MKDSDITHGKYRHHKGNEYNVLGVARHSETHEDLVVYVSTKDITEIWVRPKKMFCETVKTKEGDVQRFQKV